MTTTSVATTASHRRWSTRFGGPLLSLILPVLIVVAWWLVSANSTSPFFPPLSKIFDTFGQTWPMHVQSDILPSLWRMFAGFLIAAVVGVGLGTLLGRVPIIAEALNPVLQFGRSVPATALVPVAVVLFGVGDLPKILLIAFVSCFPILLNTIAGVRNVDPVLEDVTRSFRLTGAQRVRWVQINAALPQVISGMRIALSLAFVVMVSSEMLGSTNGIGYVTLLAQQGFQIPLMWSGLILLGLLGLIINAIFVVVEHSLLRWYTQTQEE